MYTVTKLSNMSTYTVFKIYISAVQTRCMRMYTVYAIKLYTAVLKLPFDISLSRTKTRRSFKCLDKPEAEHYGLHYKESTVPTERHGPLHIVSTVSTDQRH